MMRSVETTGPPSKANLPLLSKTGTYTYIVPTLFTSANFAIKSSDFLIYLALRFFFPLLSPGSSPCDRERFVISCLSHFPSCRPFIYCPRPRYHQPNSLLIRGFWVHCAHLPKLGFFSPSGPEAVSFIFGGTEYNRPRHDSVNRLRGIPGSDFLPDKTGWRFMQSGITLDYMY